ncbi:hypothetical protein MUY35_04010 [Aliiroseovarius sp. S1339]|uniref:hypothetical protein n=1 Tax=Aliiroseovarius sp. S1339 TaxID=2936990 RepID=UPI0020BEC9F7|nr:hypothetical protein [Aliiroseovarius sp. S1339]MCK8463011.1 hypothetical protein [Aliiroseovarius sp. S1339]
MFEIEFTNGVTISSEPFRIAWPSAFEDIDDNILLHAYTILAVSNETGRDVEILVSSEFTGEEVLASDDEPVQLTVGSTLGSEPENQNPIEHSGTLKIKEGSHIVRYNVHCETGGEKKMVATQSSSYFGE